MVYSSSEGEYDKIYNKFLELTKPKLIEYFNNNWQCIRHEWTTYSMVGNLGNYTNNRLESVNGKIKQLVQKRSDLMTFIRDFFKWLDHHNVENDRKASKNFTERAVDFENFNDVEKQYARYLTREAYELLKKEIIGRYSISLSSSDEINHVCTTQFKDITMSVFIKSCQCQNALSYSLPCRHIFAVRERFALPLFEESLYAKRWSKVYYKSTQRSFKKVADVQRIAPILGPDYETTISEVISDSRGFTMMEFQRKLNIVLTDLVGRGSLACGEFFDRKIQVLAKIELFSNAEEIVIRKVDGVLPSPILDIQDGSPGAKNKQTKNKPASVLQKRKLLIKFTQDIKILAKSWAPEYFAYNIDILRETYDAWLKESKIV